MFCVDVLYRVLIISCCGKLLKSFFIGVISLFCIMIK